MSTVLPPAPEPEVDGAPPVDYYHHAEGFTEPDERREWMLVAVGLTALVAVLAAVIALVSLATSNDEPARTVVAAPAAKAEPATSAAAPTLADAKGVEFEPFEAVDPTLPAVPPGPVKKFDVDVYQHVTQVSQDLAPTEVWSFAVNGKKYSGTGVSAPMVVNEGDVVDFTLTNGSTKAMRSTCRTRWTSTPPRSTPARGTPTSRPGSRCTTGSPPITRARSCTTAPPSRS
jgi:hypothetical protein